MSYDQCLTRDWSLESRGRYYSQILLGHSERHVVHSVDAQQQIIVQLTKIMSAYYGNLLPASLPAGTTQETFPTSEGKFEANFYTSSQNMGYGEGEARHPGFPRFPPYDRIDISPITSKAGFNVNTSTYQSGTVPNYTLPGQQNGQFTDELNNCKLPQESSLVSSPSLTNSHHQSGMVSHFNANGLGMGHPSQAQNIPIYPWMRPMNGGKQMQPRLKLHHVLLFLLCSSCNIAPRTDSSPVAKLRGHEIGSEIALVIALTDRGN